MANASTYINYHSGHGYSSEEIITLGEKYKELANRDIEELRKVGVNEEFILNLQTKIDEFKAIPTELQDREAVKKTTRDKTEIKKYIENVLISLKLQLMYHLNDNNQSTTTFRDSTTGKKHNHLLQHIENISQILTYGKEKYSSYGIKTEVIDEIATFHKQLSEAALNQEMAMGDKIENSLMRSKLKEKIYSICKHLSTLGKLTWQKTDELKYKDYLITKPKKRGRKVGSKNRVND